MAKTELNAHETELLKLALPFCQELGEVPTQAVLMDKLRCRDKSARNIQHYLLEIEAVKLADRVEALPGKAEDKAVVQHSLGEEQFGSSFSSVVRENVRLRKALAKAKHKDQADAEERAQGIRAEIDAMKEMAKEEIKYSSSVAPKYSLPSGNMLEVNLPDAHFGKLSWPQETGGAPYDSKIAQITYSQAVDALIERTKMYKYDEVLYVVGNDILNAENSDSETTKGTVVDSDGRFVKTFWKARRTVIETIEKLLKIAPVKVMAIYGNHDQLSSWHLADSVECFFHENKNVTVFNNPTYRKYYEFGKNMFLFTHGDKGSREDFPLLMATEQPEMFGRTQFHEAHCGHTHETKMQEKHGVRVRVLPALCPADAWHSENGYIGNLRNAEAYIWNTKEGLIGTAVFNVDSQPEVNTKREVV